VKFNHVATILVAASVCTLGQAQAPVFGHRTYNGAYTYSHGDLNNDGREDLVFQKTGGFGVVVSTGDATYGTETDYAVPNNQVSATVLLDMNNDGKLDIIAFNSFAPGFYEYLNNGSGTFHLQTTYPMSNVQAMVVGDFNHDGFPDIAFTTAGPQALHVWFNNHAGAFNAGPTTTVPNVAGLSVGDFDGDGKADIVSSSSTGTYVYFGDNTGHFTIVNAATTHHPQVVAMDIDRDGRSDLVGAAVASSNQGVDTFFRDLFVIYGNSSRAIAESSIPLNGYAVAWVYGNNLGTSPSADIADFNGDGRMDLALVEAQNSDGTGTRSLVVMTGKGGRQWNPETTVYSDSTLDFGVAAIRANQDSKADLLVDTFANNTTTAQFFVNDGTASYWGGCALPNAATGISVCTGTTYSSTSVRFSASAAGQTTMRKMELWVDGVKKYEQIEWRDFSHYAHLDTTQTLSAGTHNVTIFAAGYDNLLQKKSYTITVQ
jgi:hypothetical protein